MYSVRMHKVQWEKRKGVFNITWNCRKELLENVSHGLSTENELEFAIKGKQPGLSRERSIIGKVIEARNQILYAKSYNQINII